MFRNYNYENLCAEIQDNDSDCTELFELTCEMRLAKLEDLLNIDGVIKRYIDSIDNKFSYVFLGNRADVVNHLAELFLGNLESDEFIASFERWIKLQVVVVIFKSRRRAT